MTTFTYIPSYTASSRTEPKIVSVKFGDGYEQRFAFGINTKPRVWDLEFNGKTESEADAIENFFLARGGVESFDWSPPTGSTGKWIVRGWNRQITDLDIHNISASFEEVFDLA